MNGINGGILLVSGNPTIGYGFGAPPGERNRGQTTISANGGFALGAAAFQDAIAERLGRRVARGKPGRPPKERD